MSKWTLSVLTIIAATCLYSCGGGGGGSKSAYVVQIQSTLVYPKTTSIKSGDSVQWVNKDTASHQVASGTLARVSNPVILPEIEIRSGNTFVPSSLSADFGDTVRWHNLTGSEFVMNIVNDAGTVIDTLTFANGEVKSYTDFPTAGKYTAQKKGNVFFSGTVTLYGIPTPNGIFQSDILPNGGTFTRKFSGYGTLPFYVLDPNDPSRAFIMGNIVVQ